MLLHAIDFVDGRLWWILVCDGYQHDRFLRVYFNPIIPIFHIPLQRPSSAIFYIFTSESRIRLYHRRIEDCSDERPLRACIPTPQHLGIQRE